MTECEEHAELNAALDKALTLIDSSFDRFQEAHYWIHQMELNYHLADPFRWSLSAFIKAMKEIPQLLTMELQNEESFSEWFRPLKNQIQADPIIKSFSKMRDGIVHQKMLLPNSVCHVGITKFRGLKLGFNVSSDPRLDSQLVMRKYLYAIRDEDDFMGILVEDEDTVPCVQREWRFTDFPDEEVIDVCAKVWLRIGRLIEQVVSWLGAAPPPLNLECRHGAQSTQFKLFDRAELRKERAQLKADYPAQDSG